MALREWLCRVVRFGCVGAISSCAQLLVLTALARWGIPEAAANVAGIFSGALVGYPLSKRLIWGDRHAVNEAIARTTFFAIAFSAFAVSETTFIMARHAGFPRDLASALGIVAGAAITFSGNNFITFRGRRNLHAPSNGAAKAYYPFDLSIIIPAFNEAPRIGGTLDVLAGFLKQFSLGAVEVLVVAADGTDDTAQIAASKAHLFPCFRLVRPGRKVGKGRDVREGMLAARGKYRLFMDADLATPVWHLLHVRSLMQDRGSVGIGVRNIGRYHNTRLRNFVSVVNSVLTRIVAVSSVSDTRCGFKVFEARVAEELFGRMSLMQWGFDTEILALCRKFGYGVTEYRINDWHDPKENGDGLVGEKYFRNIVDGTLDPFRIRLKMMLGHYNDVPPAHARGQIKLPAHKRNRTVWATAATAAVFSVVSYVIVAIHHAVLQFSDTNSYLLIARRTIEGSTPGVAQLGGSWLPFPELLQLPFVWINPMYQSGLSASIWSMAGYVVSVVLMYLIVIQLTGKKSAGLVAAGVFGLSSYVLYLQSTPMTESLMFTTILASVYFVQKWIETDHHLWLAAASISEMLATVTRYEAWMVTVVLSGIVLLVAWRRRVPNLDRKRMRRRTVDRLLIAVPNGFSGIVLWCLWCQLIFHSWHYFVNGAYAKPPVGQSPAIGNLTIATKTYVFAMVDTVGTPVLMIGAIGLAAAIVQIVRRKQPLAITLPAFALLAIIPFYIYTVYSGERPLDVMQYSGHNYNIRYGLLALLPAAIFCGFLVSLLKRTPVRSMCSIAVITATILVSVANLRAGIDKLVGIEHSTQASHEAVVAFGKYYTGGLVLMQSWGNEAFVKQAVPVSELVYEGSNGLWFPALRSPIKNHISYIVVRVGGDTSDAVRSNVNAGELSNYKKVWTDGTYTIYKEKQPWLLALNRRIR